MVVIKQLLISNKLMLKLVKIASEESTWKIPFFFSASQHRLVAHHLIIIAQPPFQKKTKPSLNLKVKLISINRSEKC